MDSFKAALANKEPLLGTFIKTPHPHITEVLAQSGFATLCLDAEHAPFDRKDLDACILAAKANRQHVIVRIPSDHHDTILNALDLGADGVVIPHVKTAQQLSRVIEQCYYGPGGRGYAGSTRMAGYTTRGIEKNLEHNKNHTSVIAQIEDLEALDNLDAICQVSGLDCLFIGRMDLTVALGETDPNSENVKKIVNQIVATANRHGVTTGMFISNLEELESWLNEKVSLFLLGSDHSFMLSGARQLQQRFKQATSAT
ncbi:aldolase [Thalassotalea litorea]|uniref:Aldolase n=1 Tax=Thalassotalea litorea TaxID=2020715 RepID=A0A5R9IMY9_9GAMM|nr:aldolase/citrate lyase family protein [Thalassotalea litorea]TLU66914.1 aldolase [Thalassotalea litorea]